jgi:tetratricopeptide (TPR) repeat protein
VRDARREFLLVLVSEPRDFLSVYSVGLTFLLDKQPAEALKCFERASQLKPHDSTLLANELRAHLRLKQEPQAATTLAELDTQLDAHDQRRVQLAALLVSEGAYELATQEFEVLHKAQPKSYEVSYNLALAYHRAGHEAQASALLENVLADKESAELEDLLGDVEQTRGERTRSLAAFRRAAELEPRNEDYRYDYAQALSRQGALNHALEVFAAATKEFPHSTHMLLGLGATYYLVGKYTEAARTILQAVQIGPERTDVFYLLGRAYDAAGPLQEAIAERFAHHVKVRPKDAWGRYFYARILVARSQGAASRELAEAQRHLEAAIELDGTLAEAHTELGHLLEIRGQLKAAGKELERAVELDPKSSTAYYKLAQVYRNLGEPDQAERAMGRFQQLKAHDRSDLGREEMQGFFEHPKQ